MVNERKEKDLEYFEKWKETGDKVYFQKLYRGMRGYLNPAIQRSAYGSNIPKEVFELEAAHQMHQALERFTPGKGANLQSFVFGAVNNKLKRVNATYQNMARITERNTGGVFNIGYFDNEKAFLKEKLKREPTSTELADTLGWSSKQVENMSLENRKDLSLNQELEDLNTFDDFSAEEAEMAMHYHDMSPDEQTVFDYATGMHGKMPILKRNGVDADWSGIARELSMPESKVQKIRKRIVRKFGSN